MKTIPPTCIICGSSEKGSTLVMAVGPSGDTGIRWYIPNEMVRITYRVYHSVSMELLMIDTRKC